MLEEGIQPLSKSLFSDGTTLSLSESSLDIFGSPFEEGLIMVVLFQTCPVRSFPFLFLLPGLLELKVILQGALPSTEQNGLMLDALLVSTQPRP